jgi:hypothetical protein
VQPKKAMLLSAKESMIVNIVKNLLYEKIPPVLIRVKATEKVLLRENEKKAENT